MNSKQRRTTYRQFPFEVDIKRLTIDFRNFDLRSERQIWCNKQFGKHNWKVNYSGFYYITYEFKKVQHKNWFIMKWI